VRAGYLAS